MNSISFWLIRGVLLAMFLALSALLVVPVYTAFQGFFDHHTTSRTILAILAFAWFLVILQASNAMASRMVFEGLGLIAAFQRWLVDVRFAIGFIPVVGPWLVPRSERQDAERNSPIE